MKSLELSEVTLCTKIVTVNQQTMVGGGETSGGTKSGRETGGGVSHGHCVAEVCRNFVHQFWKPLSVHYPLVFLSAFLPSCLSSGSLNDLLLFDNSGMNLHR